MAKIISSFLLPALLLLIGLSTAHAQATRTWVSGVGNDANPCSRTAPCKTFAGAISMTAPGGEIDVLDPGGFGGVTISKSISIISDSVEAGVLVSGTNGITINAAGTDVVYLRGLNFDGVGTGLAGIKIVQAGSVHIEKSLIRGFTTANSSAIAIAPAAAPVSVFVSETTIAQNKQGVVATPLASVAAKVMLDRVTIENTNGPAVRADAHATIRVTNSVINNNTRGVQQTGSGKVISLGNNTLAGNNTDGAFDSTIPLQ